MKIKYVGIILSLVLVGCGFHLRHHHAHIHSRYPVMVLAPSGSITFNQTLTRAFDQENVKILKKMPPASHLPKLTIQTEEMTQSPLVSGPDSELRRERLKFAVTFLLDSPDGQQTFHIVSQRDRQLNNKQHLGDNDEKILIEQEMQNDVIDQLMRYLDTVGRAA